MPEDGSQAVAKRYILCCKLFQLNLKTYSRIPNVELLRGSILVWQTFHYSVVAFMPNLILTNFQEVWYLGVKPVSNLMLFIYIKS